MKVNRSRARRAIVALCTGLLITPVSGAPASASASESTRCKETSFRVTVNGQSGPLTGTFCAPPQATAIQVLIPGITYNRSYWDFPYGNGSYSYTQQANRAGYATLAIDRLGTGNSWHPLSTAIDYDAHVSAVHEVIQAIRQGGLGVDFDKIILVGHSYGSIVAYGVAGTYRDVDALVSTGASHTIDSLELATTFTAISYPALLDPKFVWTLPDPGYLTTRPGTRQAFYFQPDASSAAIQADEELKDLSTLTEVVTTPTSDELRRISQRIDIPVLTVLGDHDSFNCGERAADCSSSESLAKSEQGYYGPEATVEAAVVPGTGHDLNLEHTREQTWTSITEFLGGHVG